MAVEHLHAVVVGVGHPDQPAVAIDGDAARLLQLARLIGLRAE
jgi:hypothetical protein